MAERGYEVHYIGSYNGIERKLIEDAGIPYDGISSGKLRRYFDLKNSGLPADRPVYCKPVRRSPSSSSLRMGEPVSTAFPSGRYFKVSGKLQQTFLAEEIHRRFASPGVISDSWMILLSGTFCPRS